MSPAEPLEAEYFSPKEVAQILNLGIDTVYRMLRAGTIPAIRLKRAYRIKKADLDRIGKGE